MRSDELVKEWEKLINQTSWPKHIIAAFGIFLGYILYLSYPTHLTGFQAFGIAIVYHITAREIFKNQEKKRHNYIYDVWEKSLTDYRYKVCLETLYEHNRGLEPYAVKTWSPTDGHQIIPDKIYNSNDSIF